MGQKCKTSPLWTKRGPQWAFFLQSTFFLLKKRPLWTKTAHSGCFFVHSGLFFKKTSTGQKNAHSGRFLRPLWTFFPTVDVFCILAHCKVVEILVPAVKASIGPPWTKKCPLSCGQKLKKCPHPVIRSFQIGST